MSLSNRNNFSHGVNQAGKAAVDNEVKPRFQRRSQNPYVLMFTNLLNAFGNFIAPIPKEKKK